MSLWFVTPAHGREQMSAICFEQRRRSIDALRRRGVDACCVVVACDGNLTLAREAGLTGLDRVNGPLGWKWNEGIQYAVEHGATHVVPIGSDDWCHPDYFTDLPAPGTVRAGTCLAVMDPGGFTLTGLGLDPRRGPVGYLPWVIPTSFGTRPARDNCRYGDVSIAAGLSRGGRVWTLAEVDALQVIDFKTPGVQQTSYQRTRDLNPVRWDDEQPFERLATRYPADLVERMQRHYHALRGA